MQLESLYKRVKSVKGKAIIEALSRRDRFRRTTDLNRLQKAVEDSGTLVGDSEFLQMFEELDASGAGNIVYGRNNAPNRFVWNYNLKLVAKRLLEGKNFDDLDPLKPLTAKETKALYAEGEIRKKKEKVFDASKAGSLVVRKNGRVVKEFTEHHEPEYNPAPVQSQSTVNVKTESKITNVLQFTFVLPDTVSQADLAALVSLLKGMEGK